MKGGTGKEPRWVTPFALSVLSFATLLLSFFVFINDRLYIDLRGEGQVTSWLFQVEGTVLMVFLCLAVAYMGLVNEERMRWPYLISWLMYVPSLLYLSDIDWFRFFGLEYDLQMLANSLPGWLIFLNGLLIVSGELVLRSYLHWSPMIKEVMKKGADPDAAGRAFDLAMMNNASKIVIASGLTFLLYLGLPYISHSFEIVAYNMGTWFNYLALPIVVGLILLLLFLARNISGHGAGPERDGDRP